MKQSRLFFFLYTLFACIFLWPCHVFSAPEFDANFSVEEAKKELELIQLQLPQQNIAGLQSLTKNIKELRGKAQKCVEKKAIDLNQISLSLANIDKLASGDTSAVSKQISPLLTQKTTLDSDIAACKLIILSADESLNLLSTKISSLEREEFFYKQSNFFVQFQKIFLEKLDLKKSFTDFLLKRHGLDHVKLHFFELFVFLSIIIFSIFLLRRKISSRIKLLQAKGEDASFLCWLKGITSPVILVTIFSSFFYFLTWKIEPRPYLPTILVVCTLTYLFFLSLSLARHFERLDQSGYSKLRHQGVGVIFFFLAWFFAGRFPFQDALPPETLFIFRTVILFLFSALSLSTLSFIKKITSESKIFTLLLSLSYFILSMVIAFTILGYLNIADYLVTAFIGSWLGLLLVTIGQWALSEILGGLAEGRLGWQQDFRRKIGVPEKEQITGLVWLKLASSFFLWIAYALLLLQLWFISSSYINKIHSWLALGFHVGNFFIVPSKIFTGLVFFGLLLSFFRWISRRMKKEMEASKLNKSAKDAAIAIFGYSAFCLAFISGLSVAGMNFSNLAIIAGALSVGIGFGLQNIINNFVSGLILLFEQPIKRGDWIVVGNTEGYVKKISVRSTIINTFDKSDVIVPNSELISGQVTNWMLSDKTGRVRIPVGVAYGSDTAQVKELLLGIAHAHPTVITDGSEGKPNVLFTDFGDSSLNFELRFFIKDVDERLLVKSDILFAIDAAFRENNVQIPFPQRDIHFRSSLQMENQGRENAGE